MKPNKKINNKCIYIIFINLNHIIQKKKLTNLYI